MSKYTVKFIITVEADDADEAYEEALNTGMDDLAFNARSVTLSEEDITLLLEDLDHLKTAFWQSSGHNFEITEHSVKDSDSYTRLTKYIKEEL
jgi:hypothetical protein